MRYPDAKPMPPFIRELRDAIRNDLKTETRRVIKPQPTGDWGGWVIDSSNSKHVGCAAWINKQIAETIYRRCPYGKPGDIRYLREPLYHKAAGDLAYYDDSDTPVILANGEPMPWRWKLDVLPQIFMPKLAARTFVKIADIRAELVQEISEEGAIAEGAPLGRVRGYGRLGMKSHREGFIDLWDRINYQRGFPFHANPWVWVIVFKRIEDPA